MSRRIAIVGASGNGKTTLGRALAERLSVPYIELDALHHGPNWTEATAEELRARVSEKLETDAWVVDGNYATKIGDLVRGQADTIVWLDHPLPLILWRLLRRTLGRIRHQEELWNGNRETWRNAFVGRESLFAWTIRSHRRFRRENPRGQKVVRLRSASEVERWLAEQE
jgi:adenylate kinase family enzyme